MSECQNIVLSRKLSINSGINSFFFVCKWLAVLIIIREFKPSNMMYSKEGLGAISSDHDNTSGIIASLRHKKGNVNLRFDNEQSITRAENGKYEIINY